MPTRSQSHQLEDRSRNAFRAALPKPWVFRDKQVDYGIDGELEIFDEQGRSTGLQALVQLKATAKATEPRPIKYKIEWIKYYLSLDIPVLLVLWVENTNELFWQWVTQVDLFYKKNGAKSLSVRFTNKWTTHTPTEINRTLIFRREVESKSVSLPIGFTMSGLVDDTLKAEVKRLFAYAPRLVTYSDTNPRAFCEIKADEAVSWLLGYQGMVIHNWSINTDEIQAKKVIFSLIFILTSNGLIDLGARFWAQIPDIDEIIDDLDFASFAMKLLARAGAADPLKHLVYSLMRRGKEDLATFPLQLLHASAPPHRKPELGALLVGIYQEMATYPDPIAKSNSYYNLARYFERSNRREARQYFEAAIRSSDFYQTKSYFWNEVGAFLFSNRRYAAALRCYSYSLNELKDQSIRLHFADALMHSGQLEMALSAFKELAQTPIDMSLPVEKGIVLVAHRAEATIKGCALQFAISELGIASQSRNSKTARAAYGLDGNLDEVISRIKSNLQIDALEVNAWFNLGYAYTKKGETDAAMLSYLMAGTVGTQDNEAWWNALGRALEIRSDVINPLLEYLHLKKGEEFIRYLAELSSKETNETTRQFINELIALLSSNLPDNTSTEIRLHKNDKSWRSVSISEN